MVPGRSTGGGICVRALAKYEDERRRHGEAARRKQETVEHHEEEAGDGVLPVGRHPVPSSR